MKNTLTAIASILLIGLLFLIYQTSTLAQRRETGRSQRVASDLSLDQQAERQANAFWNARITKCGEDYYSRDRSYIHQFRGARIAVTSQPVSGADRLNGISWRGQTTMTTAQSRTYSPQATLYQNTGWSNWTEGLSMAVGGVGLSAELRREKAQWAVTPKSISQAGVLEAVSCDDAANPLEAYRKWRRGQEELKMNAEVRDFLRISESYWHVYTNDLPGGMYQFLAKNPNKLYKAIFFPSGAWAISGNYNNAWDNLPTEVITAVKERRDLTSLAVAPNGGWIMLHSGTEHEHEDLINRTGYVPARDEPIRRGFVSNNFPQATLQAVWSLYNSWNYVDLIRFTPKGEWVLISHKGGAERFDFRTNVGTDQEFSKALYRLWEQKANINDIAFTPDGGFVIIYNRRRYIYDNIPPKMMAALESWNKLEQNEWRTVSISCGPNGEWILFGWR